MGNLTFVITWHKEELPLIGGRRLQTAKKYQ